MKDMILEIVRIIIGLMLALFIPGFFVVMLFFREFKLLEKIAFSVVFSIMIDVGIAVWLGYNSEQAAITGGLTFANILNMQIIVISVLLAFAGLKFLLMRRTKFIKKKITPRRNVNK
jgi:uncharacterized membrane protein